MFAERCCNFRAGRVTTSVGGEATAPPVGSGGWGGAAKPRWDVDWYDLQRVKTTGGSRWGSKTIWWICCSVSASLPVESSEGGLPTAKGKRKKRNRKTKAGLVVLVVVFAKQWWLLNAVAKRLEVVGVALITWCQHAYRLLSLEL